MNSDQKKGVKIYAIASTFFYEVLLIVAVLFFLGYLLDTWLNTVFVFKAIAIILGVLAGIRNIIKRIYKVENDDERS
jgi:F0F1-type ATP synthase assembly protein I